MPLEITENDIAVFETLGELGMADTDILRSLHFPNDNSQEYTRRRLKRLADAGFLYVTQLTATNRHKKGGSLAKFWFLSESGADLVESHTGLVPQRITRSEPAAQTLKHRNEMVKARLAIDAAAQALALPPPGWIMEQDTNPNIKRSKTRSPSEYILLKSHYKIGNRHVAFRPDASCHFQVPHPKFGHVHLYAYFELDRGTEGHEQWRQRKLPGIDSFLSQPNDYLQHWPTKHEKVHVRLMVICQSQTRLRNLTATIKETSNQAAMFRFTTFPLDPETVLTGHVWKDCDNADRSILGGQPPR